MRPTRTQPGRPHATGLGCPHTCVRAHQVVYTVDNVLGSSSSVRGVVQLCMALLAPTRMALSLLLAWTLRGGSAGNQRGGGLANFLSLLGMMRPVRRRSRVLLLLGKGRRDLALDVVMHHRDRNAVANLCRPRRFRASRVPRPAARGPQVLLGVWLFEVTVPGHHWPTVALAVYLVVSTAYLALVPLVTLTSGVPLSTARRQAALLKLVLALVHAGATAVIVMGLEALGLAAFAAYRPMVGWVVVATVILWDATLVLDLEYSALNVETTGASVYAVADADARGCAAARR